MERPFVFEINFEAKKLPCNRGMNTKNHIITACLPISIYLIVHPQMGGDESASRLSMLTIIIYIYTIYIKLGQNLWKDTISIRLEDMDDTANQDNIINAL